MQLFSVPWCKCSCSKLCCVVFAVFLAVIPCNSCRSGGVQDNHIARGPVCTNDRPYYSSRGHEPLNGHIRSVSVIVDRSSGCQDADGQHGSAFRCTIMKPPCFSPAIKMYIQGLVTRTRAPTECLESATVSCARGRQSRFSSLPRFVLHGCAASSHPVYIGFPFVRLRWSSCQRTTSCTSLFAWVVLRLFWCSVGCHCMSLRWIFRQRLGACVDYLPRHCEGSFSKPCPNFLPGIVRISSLT